MLVCSKSLSAKKKKKIQETTTIDVPIGIP